MEMYTHLEWIALVSWASAIQKTVSNHVLLGNLLIFAEIWLVTDIINCHLLVRSLQGIRITQAAVGSRQTMLVSDIGSVYAFGTDNFWVAEVSEAAHDGKITTPQIVESLKGIFVVQAAIGGYFSAILTREGQVYTFSWGQGERFGHSSDPSDVQPRLLPGLEDAPVAHISAGTCYLLMLAYQPNGM
jgi:alpha-tubulin suppressor-like RCC1 family protein